MGDIGDLNTKTLTAAAVCGVLRPQLADVNMVSASVIAQERGIQVEETRRGSEGAYGQYMRLSVKTERQERSVAGTVFSDGKPRIIQVRGINIEASLDDDMLYIENSDKPGFIGALGTVLGEAGVNIAHFNLGRDEEAGKQEVAGRAGERDQSHASRSDTARVDEHGSGSSHHEAPDPDAEHGKHEGEEPVKVVDRVERAAAAE